MVRAVGRAPAAAPSLIIDSWRVTSRIKGDSAAAVLDQIELQYGPDDRAIKLKGNANLTFGRRPEVNGVLSSPQIDLDRVLGLPEATRRRPLVAIKTLAESFVAAARLPIPTTLSIGVENVTLGGAMLARVGADVKTDADGVDIKRLELRAPGVTQVRVSGRLRQCTGGHAVRGNDQVEANDPRALIAWLTDRTEQQAPAAGPWRVEADVTLGSDSIAIERLKLELDRMAVDGRLAYAWANDERPARLDAAITAPEIDLDRVNASGQGDVRRRGLRLAARCYALAQGWSCHCRRRRGETGRREYAHSAPMGSRSSSSPSRTSQVPRSRSKRGSTPRRSRRAARWRSTSTRGGSMVCWCCWKNCSAGRRTA